MAYLFLSIAIVAEVGGTLSLRMAAVGRKRWYAVVAPCYVIAFAMLALVLQRGMHVGVAYGIWAAAGVALTAFFAWVFFDEPLTWVMGLGLIAIVGGVLLVELGTHA